ncbi:hypothetical protein ACJX0J_005602, partial [Zea mays]
ALAICLSDHVAEGLPKGLRMAVGFVFGRKALICLIHMCSVEDATHMHNAYAPQYLVGGMEDAVAAATGTKINIWAIVFKFSEVI